jgi:mannitol 2-dehydrogenase/sorbose reductase
MVEYFYAAESPQKVLERLANPDTRIVSLTITEGGYNIDEGTGEFRLDHVDVANDLSGAAPRTAFGFIVGALEARYNAGRNPFTVVSCDNLRGNGDTARRAIVSFARARSSHLASWIEENVSFPNSMVDRIAPQVVEDEKLRINASSRVNDRVPATCETFTKWVIEDRFSNGRPQMELAGVEFRSDIAAFEAVKGRLLNAAHMLMGYPSLLIGHRFVHEGMTEAVIVRLLQNFWDLDAVPLVTPPEGFSVQNFNAETLKRFANPAIRDQLLRIAYDGASKIPVFHTKTIRELIAGDRDISREAFLMACFSRYLLGADDLAKRFEINEPQFTDEDWKILKADNATGLFRTSPFRALGLHESRTFREKYLVLSQRLASEGCAATLASILV